MYNRVGPSELALGGANSDTLGSHGANFTGRRPQTQENVGARGGRRNYKPAQTTTQSRAIYKISSAIGKRRMMSSDRGDSSLQNTSTQGGSNLKFTVRQDGAGGIGHGSGYHPDIISQRLHPQSPDPDVASATRYDEKPKTATRISRYRHKLKNKNGLNSTLYLQQQLSMLSYNAPGAHTNDRVRCSTRHQSYRHQQPSHQQFLTSDDFVPSKGRGPRGHSNNMRTKLEETDSIGISTGEKEVQPIQKRHLRGETAKIKSGLGPMSGRNIQILSKGVSLEDGQKADTTNLARTSEPASPETRHHKGEKTVSPRGGRRSNRKSKRSSLEGGKGGSVFFVDITKDQEVREEDTIISSSYKVDGEEQDTEAAMKDACGFFTTRDQIEPGFFDSVMGSRQMPYDPHSLKSVTASFDEPNQRLGSSGGSPTTQTQRQVVLQSKNNHSDFQVLGNQVHSLQEHFNKKAEKLYKGTVLIDRLRTRDIAAAKLRAKKLSPPRPDQQLSKATTTNRAYNQNLAHFNKSKGASTNMQGFAMTSRDKYTQEDTDMVTDELGNSVSSLPADRKHQWLISSLESISSNMPTDRVLIQNAFDTDRKPLSSKNRAADHYHQQSTRPIVRNRIQINRKGELESDQEEQFNLLVGPASKTESQQRVQRYMGDVHKWKVMDEVEEQKRKEARAKVKTRQTIIDFFYTVFDMLKEQNKERWAARRIQMFVRDRLRVIRHNNYLKWLPIDIDPENCDFSDVERVLKVLDDYAITKLGILQNQPKLLQVVMIQRAVKSYLIRTRLTRCVRDCVKMVRGVKAMQRFADRAPLQKFLVKFDKIHGAQILIDRVDQKEKLARERRIEDRQRRIDAGEPVSDTSSQKKAKRIAKQELMDQIKRRSTVSEDRISSPTRQRRLLSRGVTQDVVIRYEPKLLDMFSPLNSDRAPVLLKSQSPKNQIQAQPKTQQQQKRKKISLNVTKKLSFQNVEEPASPAVIHNNRKTSSMNTVNPKLLQKKNQSDMTIAENKHEGEVAAKVATTKELEESMLKIKMIKMAKVHKNITLPLSSKANRRQSNLMSHSPIKTQSRRKLQQDRQQEHANQLILNIDQGGSCASTGRREREFINSNETLLKNTTGSFDSRQQLKTKSNQVSHESFFKNPASKNIRVSVGGAGNNIPGGRMTSSNGGLSVKTVKHFIDRDCMWYHPTHDKQDWHLRNNPWRKRRKPKHAGDSTGSNMASLVSQQSMDSISKKKMRQIRRKQFFSFFEGFFERNPNNSLKLQTHGISFSEEEKADLLKNYFKQYFQENLDVSKSKEEESLEKEYGMNTNLKPGDNWKYNSALDYIAENHKYEFLGKSQGKVGSYVKKNQENELQEVFEERIKRKMKPSKVLIQSQFVPGKPKTLEELMDDDMKHTQRSIHRVDNSALSYQLSKIPNERAATVLSSLFDGSKHISGDKALADFVTNPHITVKNMDALRDKHSSVSPSRKMSLKQESPNLRGKNPSMSPSRKMSLKQAPRRFMSSQSAATSGGMSKVRQSKGSVEISLRESAQSPRKESPRKGAPSKQVSPSHRGSMRDHRSVRESAKQIQARTGTTQSKAYLKIKQQEEKLKWQQGNPHSDIAPELEENCMEAKLKLYRLQQMQADAENAKITDDFAVGFPEYQTILEKYTPSAIFGGRQRYASSGGGAAGDKGLTGQTDDQLASVQSSDQWLVRGQKLFQSSMMQSSTTK